MSEATHLDQRSSIPQPMGELQGFLQRLCYALGPLGAGIVIDLLDLATFGPIGILVGALVGGYAGWVLGEFEGFDQNTFERLRDTQQRYELDLPFGHDAVAGGVPTIMEDYRTRGTPWFIIIDPSGEIVFSDFHLDADRLIARLDQVDLSSE